MTKDFRELGETTCIRAPSEMTKKIALKKKDSTLHFVFSDDQSFVKFQENPKSKTL